MRTRLARTCEPTASTTVRPKPKKIWSAVTARSYTLLGGHAPDVDGGDEGAMVAVVLVRIGLGIGRGELKPGLLGARRATRGFLLLIVATRYLPQPGQRSPGWRESARIQYRQELRNIIPSV